MVLHTPIFISSYYCEYKGTSPWSEAAVKLYDINIFETNFADRNSQT